MKQRTVPQVAVIAADTPEQLQEKMNAELLHHPDVTRMTLSEGNSNRAIIQYTITEDVPEDEADRYYMETGKRFCCNDCPECIWDPDRRAVTHWCDLHQDRVRLKSPACDDFYLRLRVGDIHPITAEERNARYEEMNRQQAARRKEEVLHGSRMFKIKKKTAAYFKELEEALNKDELTQPHYVLDCYDTFLGVTALLPHEIALFVYGVRKQLSEAEIIGVAKMYESFGVWKVSEPSFIDEDTMTWANCECVWTGNKKATTHR